MRKSLWLLASLLFLSSVFCAAEAQASIAWQPWSRSVFETAKNEHKRVLLFGKVSWCHWCQKMQASTFPDPAVTQLINRYFVPVKIDLEEDVAVGQRYHISEIPAIIILNDHNQELKRYYGYASASSLLHELERYMGS